ncbi:hypothetical protein QTP70_012729 [Hemibagrus guttatus]|uniref:Reverse transcriptase/retrotransposon-derived protein RNase H-like domain-containing protein n=1 Tax=Hemibagrus guttatus TaxID=175788 RepID=A0AAE0VCZ6_9TELE|nr:hypothetical protein QTP70_012729 [Hemibagrus guttatus]
MSMDPNTPAASMTIQNTSPTVDPAEYAHLQGVVACQGTMIRAYQEQLAALQATHELQQRSPTARMTPPAAIAPLRSEVVRLALPKKWPREPLPRIFASIEPNTSEPATIPQGYHDLREVFSKERATQFSPHCPWDCTIDLLPPSTPPEGTMNTMDSIKVKAVMDWPEPTTIKELQRFLGFDNFYCRCIRNYSSIASPLTSLLRSKPRRLQWTEQARVAFIQLKKSFTSAPILEECRHWLERA